MLSSPPAVQLNSLLPALTAHPRMGATQATTAFSFLVQYSVGTQQKSLFQSSWGRKFLGQEKTLSGASATISKSVPSAVYTQQQCGAMASADASG